MRDRNQFSDGDEVCACLTAWLEDHGATVSGPDDITATYRDEHVPATQATISGQPQDQDQNQDPNTAGLTQPDLLVETDDHTALVFVAPEPRYRVVTQTAYDTFAAWQEYHAEQLAYSTDEDTHTPDSFVCATQYSPHGHLCRNTHEFFFEYDPEEIDGINESLPRYEGNLSALLTRMLWRMADGEDYQQSIASLGVLTCDTLEAIPDFDVKSDAHAMCRASAIETQGAPAVFTGAQGQDWLVL